LSYKLKEIDDRKLKLLKYSILIAGMIVFFFSIFNFGRNENLIAIIELFLFFISITIFTFTLKKKFITFNMLALLLGSYSFTIFSFSLGRFHFTLFSWALMTIGLTFYFVEKRFANTIVSIYLAITYFLLFKQYVLTDEIPTAGLLNVAALILSFTGFLHYYEATRNESEEKLLKEIGLRKKIEVKNKRLIYELETSIEKVKQLSSFLPICSSCKSIRDDNGYWEQIEDYVSKHSDTQFSHSLCPSCVQELYPDFSDNMDDDS